MTNSKLPIQSAPVDRQINGAAVSGENGVDASGFLDTLGTIAKTVAPIALPALSSLI
ncbi:MAG: hypothetical protein AAGD25_19170 [Cyanobacteria bacterium P01_F01_bin.150]